MHQRPDRLSSLTTEVASLAMSKRKPYNAETNGTAKTIGNVFNGHEPAGSTPSDS